VIEGRFVEPWVGSELLDSASLRAIVAEESEDHVLEFRRKPGSVNLLEVSFNLAGQE